MRVLLSARSDIGVSHIARYCRGIVSLNLAHCRNVTDKAMALLARRCRNLTALNLSFCPKVTSAGLMSIGALSHRLRLPLVADLVRLLAHLGLQRPAAWSCVTWRCRTARTWSRRPCCGTWPRSA